MEMKKFPDKFFDLALVDPPYGDALGNLGGAVEKAGQQPLRREFRQVQEATMHSEYGSAERVTRTGGTWASKYAKKL